MLLILNETKTHLTPNVCQLMNSCNTEEEYILPYYTSKLPPMDIGMNKPFKNRMRVCVEDFMVMYGIDKKLVRHVIESKSPGVKFRKCACEDMETHRYIGDNRQVKNSVKTFLR